MKGSLVEIRNMHPIHGAGKVSLINAILRFGIRTKLHCVPEGNRVFFILRHFKPHYKT